MTRNQRRRNRRGAPRQGTPPQIPTLDVSSSRPESHHAQDDLFATQDDTIQVPSHGHIEAQEDMQVDDGSYKLVCYPWMDSIDFGQIPKPLSAVKLLTNEISCFVRYMDISEDAIKSRQNLVERIRLVVQAYWPHASLSDTGAASSHLNMPNSIIGLVIGARPSEQPSLKRIVNRLKHHGLCQNHQLNEQASVPFIKFEDPLTHIKACITVNGPSGLDRVEQINHMLDSYPGSRPIALIAKHLLALHELDSDYGGMNDYALVCLVVSFMQMHPKVSSGTIDPTQNLGVLLLDFFQLYGINFNMNAVGIDVRGDGSYYDKSVVSSGTTYSIKDPLEPSHDIKLNARNSMLVSQAFRFAYLSMEKKALSHEAELQKNGYQKLDDQTLEDNEASSILGSCIHITNDILNLKE